MRHRRGWTAVLLVCGLLLSMVLGAGLASAAPRSDAAGAIHVVSNVVDASSQAGRNTKIEATAHVVFTGNFAGTAVEIYSAVIHPSGKTNLHGRGFFTGTVDGLTGTFEYVFHGDENGGMIVIDHASGGLSGLSGQARYEPVGPADFTYSGHFQFAP